MRLYNIFYVCKACLPRLKKVSTGIKSNNNEVYNIYCWGNAKRALDTLKKIECFEKDIDELYSMIDAYRIKLETSEIPRDNKFNFEKKLCAITTSVENFVKLCDMTEMGKAESGIDVKIPKCESLKEYMWYLKEIDFMFTQCPYLLHKDEEIRFDNVDVGSQWLAFAIAGTAGTFCILNNLASIIKKVIEIKSNILVYKQQELFVEEYRHRKDAREDVMDETVEMLKKMKDVVMNASVRELENDLGELNDSEERDKVRRTMETMAILMDKGVEIYSSIETPKEIKVLFPFEKDAPILPDNILKLIEEKNSGEQET